MFVSDPRAVKVDRDRYGIFTVFRTVNGTTMNWADISDEVYIEDEVLYAAPPLQSQPQGIMCEF